MFPTTKKDFLVDKTNLFNTTFLESPLAALAAGEILFKIDKYAFTSNNITYAVVGEQVKYWDFFPAEAPYGIVPVWGFGEVVASNNPEVAVGERCYGYFPMSDYLRIKPGNVKPHGFSDISEHRTGLAPIYNFYARTAADPSYQKEKEDFQPIIKPLFATAFLIYYFLKDTDFFGAENIVLTSASSKTALGLAFLLNKNKKEDGKKIIGLTSDKNIGFVKNSGYYDEVISYENVLNNLPKNNAVVVDFAGNSKLIHVIYDMLGDALKHAALIGLTDWQSYNPFKQIPVAKFFFAPTHIQNKYKEWGAEKTNLLLGTAMNDFIKDAEKWIELTYINSETALADLYAGMLKGEVDPSKGYIVRLK
ncbi:MAG: DUF2855 family protein [Saprospiraceae bacterium]